MLSRRAPLCMHQRQLRETTPYAIYTPRNSSSDLQKLQTHETDHDSWDSNDVTERETPSLKEAFDDTRHGCVRKRRCLGRERDWLPPLKDEGSRSTARRSAIPLSGTRGTPLAKKPRKIRSRGTCFQRNDVCEAAEQFCRDCRQAAEGVYSTFPKLSYYVDAVKKKDKSAGGSSEEEQKMVFVKTSDGLTKVVFSSMMDDALDPAISSVESSQSKNDTPRTNAAYEATLPGMKLEEAVEKKSEILTSRVICPGRSAQPATKSVVLPMAPAKANPVTTMSQVPVESRVIGKNGQVFERPFQSLSLCEGHVLHGRPDHPSLVAPSTTVPSLSRPSPLARFGAVGTSQSPAAPPELPFAPLPYRESPYGPAVLFRMGQKETEAVPKAAALQRPSLSQSFAGNPQHQVYPRLRPRADVPPSAAGGYFVPSISESLKEAVQPNVPSVHELETPAAVSSRLGLSSESTIVLMNILEWVKSGASLQSISRDSSCMESPAGPY